MCVKSVCAYQNTIAHTCEKNRQRKQSRKIQTINCKHYLFFYYFFFFSSRRRHTRCSRDWSSDVCSSDLLLPVASGMLATGPRLLQKASWRRPKKAADFPIGARPLRGVRGSARSRASLAVQAFWVQVYSQNRPLFISGTSGSSMSSGRSARCAEWPPRTGGRALLPGRRRAKSSQVPETPLADREKPALGVGSILRHAREPTQLLCAGGGPLRSSMIWPRAADRCAPATAIPQNRYFPAPRRGFGPAENLSTAAPMRRAAQGIAGRQNP